jgi:hypothetical protein
MARRHGFEVRRNADGSLAIELYRRRARRLRHMARARRWRALRRVLAEGCRRLLARPGRWPMAGLAGSAPRQGQHPA